MPLGSDSILVLSTANRSSPPLPQKMSSASETLTLKALSKTNDRSVETPSKKPSMRSAQFLLPRGQRYSDQWKFSSRVFVWDHPQMMSRVRWEGAVQNVALVLIGCANGTVTGGEGVNKCEMFA